jgi:hypothetical protein
MIDGIKRRINRAWFDFRCSGIYDTPPVKCNPDSNLVIVSQMHHPDMIMYLLAVKSFARFIQPREFLVVDDGLHNEDKITLSKHLGTVRFILSDEVQLGSCPSGACWERIITLSKESENQYVIQLDADTLTLREPTEVLQCLTANRTFTLGTGFDIVSFSEASKYAHQNTSNHVQAHAERALTNFPRHETLKYVRGCAGFTGFAKGQLPKEMIEGFSIQMSKLIGPTKWSEWGSEQVTSNYMAANANGSVVLPVERYPFWEPGVQIDKAVFVHFFGTYRFDAGMYHQQARQLLHEISSQ